MGGITPFINENTNQNGVGTKKVTISNPHVVESKTV